MLVAPRELRLSEPDRAMLGGAQGEGTAMAMRVMTRAAAVMGAPHLIDVSSAHIDGCLSLGAIVARELYGVVMPIVVVDAAVWQRLCDLDGMLTVTALEDGSASLCFS